MKRRRGRGGTVHGAPDGIVELGMYWFEIGGDATSAGTRFFLISPSITRTPKVKLWSIAISVSENSVLIYYPSVLVQQVQPSIFLPSSHANPHSKSGPEPLSYYPLIDRQWTGRGSHTKGIITREKGKTNSNRRPSAWQSRSTGCTCITSGELYEPKDLARQSFRDHRNQQQYDHLESSLGDYIYTCSLEPWDCGIFMLVSQSSCVSRVAKSVRWHVTSHCGVCFWYERLPTVRTSWAPRVLGRDRRQNCFSVMGLYFSHQSFHEHHYRR